SRRRAPRPPQLRRHRRPPRSSGRLRRLRAGPAEPPVGSLGGAMTPIIDPTQGLLAESEIRRCLLRYVRGVDRLDLELVRSCYHPDATDSHGSFLGTVDEFLVWVERILRRYDLTMHFLGSPLVEFDDATHARVETYGMAFHRAADGPPERNLVTGFRFVDRFESRDGAWRITQRI